jgi:hypothetical protein
MKPIDKFSMGPTREEFPNEDGSVVIVVTAASWAFRDAKPCRVYLTKSEYKAYREWLGSRGLIQYMLPTLSASQREILLTGISDEEFGDIVNALDEEPIDPEEDNDGSHPAIQNIPVRTEEGKAIRGAFTDRMTNFDANYEEIEERVMAHAEEVCERCGIKIRPEGGHRCESCGRDI